MHKEVIDVFLNYKKAYKDLQSNNSGINLLESNSLDFYVYPDIPINIEVQVKRVFNLFDDEKVLFICDLSLDRSINEGFVITDCGLLFVIGSEHEINIYWNDINTVECCGNKLHFSGSFGDESELVVDISSFLKKDIELIDATLLAKMLSEMAKAYTLNESIYLGGNCLDKRSVSLKENTATEIKVATVKKYPKYEIEKFKEESISKVKNLLIVEAIIVFICLSLGGIMVIFPIIFAVPTIISLFSFLSLINKDDEYWEREYSKLWKNLSDVDKLKTAAKIAGGIFKLFG